MRGYSLSKCQVLIFLLQNVHCQPFEVISTECGSDAILPCVAVQKSSNYRVIYWYKVIASQRNGIVQKTQIRNKVNKYQSFARDIHLSQNESLILPNARPEDSGTYICMLSANIGEANKESLVNLNVTNCTVPLMWSSPSPALYSQTSLVTLNLTVNSSAHCQDQQIELSFGVLATGFTLVSVVKLVLSVCLTLIIFRMRKKT
ncbi:uncharacterized protein LOC114658608 [Erpetoichthys calabaricus]|uniref:uncharacterized protein LOC114658608 n=1 Tax=Erpetoichthys calabaricus TaxID=27687 RepID=UPI0010A09B02|nr:uncharacterized protein LOC114658608 [Erpetoichthys calabaricus]